MKKLLALSVLLLSGCVSDLTKYPHYTVPESPEKARLYIPYEDARNSKPVQKVMRQYFLPASSRQHADFTVEYEKSDDEMQGFASYFFSAITFWILPTWQTREWTVKFSLTDIETGRKTLLSDVHIKDRIYWGWLLSPMLFSSNVYFLTTDHFGLASAIEEAASLIYNPNSRLYRQEKKWQAPNTPVKEKPVEQPQKKAPVAAPAAPAPQKPITEENMDLLW